MASGKHQKNKLDRSRSATRSAAPSSASTTSTTSAPSSPTSATASSSSTRVRTPRRTSASRSALSASQTLGRLEQPPDSATSTAAPQGVPEGALLAWACGEQGGPAPLGAGPPRPESTWALGGNMRGTSRSLTVVALLAGVSLGLGFAFPAVAAEGQPIFTLSDPKGDDHGDGTLHYPLRPDMQPGDLDLVQLSAFAQSGGTVFEATFARSVRHRSAAPLTRSGPLSTRSPSSGSTSSTSTSTSTPTGSPARAARRRSRDGGRPSPRQTPGRRRSASPRAPTMRRTC